ncbi:MAG: hypothetical protein RJA63_2632 [Pseudomonadota bacterium]|jgi:hypothetical protein
MFPIQLFSGVYIDVQGALPVVAALTAVTICAYLLTGRALQSTGFGQACIRVLVALGLTALVIPSVNLFKDAYHSVSTAECVIFQFMAWLLVILLGYFGGQRTRSHVFAYVGPIELSFSMCGANLLGDLYSASLKCGTTSRCSFGGDGLLDGLLFVPIVCVVLSWSLCAILAAQQADNKAKCADTSAAA